MSEHADTADITFEALPDDLAATPLVPDSPVAMAESAAVFGQEQTFNFLEIQPYHD